VLSWVRSGSGTLAGTPEPPDWPRPTASPVCASPAKPLRNEDRFGITGARWSPDGAETILKIRAVVVNGDLDDYMALLQAALPRGTPPQPLRPRHHRGPQPRRM